LVWVYFTEYVDVKLTISSYNFCRTFIHVYFFAKTKVFLEQENFDQWNRQTTNAKRLKGWES